MADSNYTKGQEYEQLTRDVVQNYLNEIKLDGEVIWDETLNGQSGATHQIDVLIKHNDSTISIIECKNYDSNVCQEKIQSFITVRDDLKNYKVKNAYFFTKTGFQSGARKIAKAYTIQLKNLKEYDRNADYAAGRIKNITATLGLLIKTSFEYHIYDSKGNELNDSFYTDGENELHKSELYNYFGYREGLKISDEGKYKGVFSGLSKYNIAESSSGIVVDSFSYEVFYKRETEKLFEINDNLTKHVVIDSENNKIQFIDEQLGLIEKKLK